MNQLVYSPLESYELMHYAIGVTCIVCDGENRHDAERCRHCHAPLALTYQADGRSSLHPHMLAVLGPQGAGKTSYLGMLCHELSSHLGDSHAVSLGAFSVALQQSVMDSFARRRFPDTTPKSPDSWNWNHLQVRDSNRRRQQGVLFPDISGAVIEDEVEHQSVPTTRAFIKKCSGAIILIDTQKLERGDPSPDFFAMKALSYLDEFTRKPKLSWSRKPIAFVFTKADCSESCLESTTDYVKANVPGTYRQATHALKRSAFFATSVAGATVQLEIEGNGITVPLRTEPRGVRAPFDWLLKQLR